jgi:energy-coupling factor transport system ATP-binding protein
LLVLDEPTANLDPPGAAAFMSRLAFLKQRGSTTIAVVEHRVDDVWPLADRLLVLGGDGRPLAEGRPEEVIERHAERMVEEGVWLPRRREPPPRASPTPSGEATEAAPVGRAIRALEGAEPRLVATGLGYAYPGGPPVLGNLDLAVGPGERVAIVGANGSGKSTLARLLVGLVAPSQGHIEIDGLPPYGQPPARRASLAGLAFQDPELGFLATSVDEEVHLGLPGDPASEQRIVRLMASLGLPLETFGTRSPYRLSGGEQRRLSLAPALLRDPALLVLDEPTFAQDRSGVATLVEILHARADAGTTIVAVSHDERFVAAFADRVLELRDGRLHERGVR